MYHTCFDSVSLLTKLYVHLRWLLYTFDLIKDCLNPKIKFLATALFIILMLFTFQVEFSDWS